MALSDRELQLIYDQLVDILRENKLGWVVEQVESQTEMGKLIEKEAQVLKEVLGEEDSKSMRLFNPQGDFGFTTGSRTKFPAIEPYSMSERVLALINGVRIAVFETAKMEIEIATFFAKEQQGVLAGAPIVYFFSDNEEAALVELHADPVDDVSESVLNLRQLIDVLSGLIAS